MYKKILSLCLVLLLALSCVSVSVSAYDPSLESLFKAPFIEYLQQDGSSVDEEFLYINYIGSTDKCSVYRAYYGEVCNVETEQIIGDYKFTYGALVGDEKTNPTGLFAWDKFGFGILPLKEAYDKGYVDLDLLYETKDSEHGMYPLTEGEELMQTLKDAYIKQWREDHKHLEEVNWFDGTLEYFYYIGEAGCHVFQAAAIPGSPVVPEDVIGDYRFTAGMCMSYCETNPAGMFAYKDGELMTLREAYEKGLVDLELLYEISDKNYVMTPLEEEEILINLCKAELEEEYGIEDAGADGSYISFAVKFDNYTVFQWRLKNPMSAFQYSYLYGYWFDEGGVLGNYTLDNYGNVEKLEETLHKGFIYLDEICEKLPEEAQIYLKGDADIDGKVTVKDATLVQKFVAKYPKVVTEFVNDPVRIAVADMDSSGGFGDPDWVNNRREITVKDATYIQKVVAGIIRDFDRQAPFYTNEVYLTPTQENTKEYALEDFPEYEFEKLEALKDEENRIVLTLKNPGHTNVIDAVNSLNYRVGTEFEDVYVALIPTEK
ncbi:MAG: dockerin type I repeat-containing protein [Clostridia bacterium]|nr:dockerin type I repeat-containing protein [Clostridia bacterium]